MPRARAGNDATPGVAFIHSAAANREGTRDRVEKHARCKLTPTIPCCMVTNGIERTATRYRSHLYSSSVIDNFDFETPHAFTLVADLSLIKYVLTYGTVQLNYI